MIGVRAAKLALKLIESKGTGKTRGILLTSHLMVRNSSARKLADVQEP